MANLAIRRVKAFMVFTLLLYGNYESVKWTGEHAVIRTAPFTKTIRVQVTALRVLMLWLEANGYVVNVQIAFGEIQFDLVRPPRWVPALDAYDVQKAHSAIQEATV